MNEIIIKENIILKSVEEFKNNNAINSLQFSKKSLRKLKNELKRNQKLVINIDISEIDDLIQIIKNIRIIYDYCRKKQITIGEEENNKIVLAYIKSSHNNEEVLSKIKDFFYVLLIADIKARYNYIYDKACDELDELFREKNFCDFKNDSCSCQRNDRTIHKTMGCCYAFYYRFDGIPVYTGECPHLTPTGCKVKCLGCKIFTCRYLKKLGIKYTADDVFLLNIFLNKKQKRYTETTYFKTQEEILKYWLKNG